MRAHRQPTCSTTILPLHPTHLDLLALEFFWGKLCWPFGHHLTTEEGQVERDGAKRDGIVDVRLCCSGVGLCVFFLAGQ